MVQINGCVIEPDKMDWTVCGTADTSFITNDMLVSQSYDDNKAISYCLITANSPGTVHISGTEHSSTLHEITVYFNLTVDENGNFSSDYYTGAPLAGDANDDGVFNVSDVVLFQKWLVAAPDIKLPNWKSADFCEDGTLDVFDLYLMKRALIEETESSDESKSLITGLKNGMTSSQVFDVIGTDYAEKSEGIDNTIEYYYPISTDEVFGTNLDGIMFVEFDTKTDLLVNYGYHLGRKGISGNYTYPYSKQELKEAYDTVMNVLTDWYGTGTKGSLSGTEEEYIWEIEDGQVWAVYGVNLWGWEEPESYEKGINEIIVSCSAS
jgi:hypothetical protein